jgi:hypothetical protein
VLVALGAGVLVAAATATTRGLRLAVHHSTAAAWGLAGLEALRAGPRTGGVETAVDPDGTPFTREALVDDGRGRPSTLETRVVFPGHVHALATEAWP